MQAAISHDEIIPNTPNVTKHNTNINFNTDNIIFKANENLAVRNAKKTIR